jgi:hypothetical protein
MATPRKPKSEHLKRGRKSKFKAEYCEQIISHMKNGNSFWSFGADVGVSMETLSNWTEMFPEFLEAKKIGEVHLLKYDENLGKAGIAGQLTRLAATVTDTKTGQVVKKFEGASFGQTAWLFTMKNRYPALYRDKREVEHSGSIGPENASDQELDNRIDALLAKRASKK